MRKITQQSVSAFFAGVNFKSGNMSVQSDSNGYYEMRLHGNLIAYRCNDGIFISNAGWSSNTTKERLNGILSHLNAGCIYQRDFVWYWKDGQEFPYNEFVKV